MPQDQPQTVEEEEECGWCKFMKAGPCRKVFEGWQACVDGVKEQIDNQGNHAVAEHCAAVTAPLFECMAKHRYYYGSQLDGMASRSKDRETETAAEASTAAAGYAHPQSSSSHQDSAQQLAAPGSGSSSSRGGHAQSRSAAAAAAATEGREGAQTRVPGNAGLATM